jgi:hypothetical protein
LMKQDFRLIAKLIGLDLKKQKELSDYWDNKDIASTSYCL